MHNFLPFLGSTIEEEKQDNNKYPCLEERGVSGGRDVRQRCLLALDFGQRSPGPRSVKLLVLGSGVGLVTGFWPLGRWTFSGLLKYQI